MTQLASPQQLERFRRIVARRLGLHFDEGKLAFLGDILRRHVETTGETPHSYLSKLDVGAGDEELSALASELTVGETYFFRNIDQFHALSQVVLPQRIRSRSADRRLRLVSAGCASGEEPFSLAISVGEAVPDPSWKISIRAVDVNRASLAKAARGRFTDWSLRETPAEIQRRYFRREGGEVVFNEATRAAVTFEMRNLVVDDPELWPPAACDVVFCRNVLMYFTAEQAQGVVTRITRALAPGGYLFLGHAETLRGLSEEFHLCHTNGTFYYQLREAGSTDVRPSRGRLPAAAAATVVDLVDGSDTWVAAIQAAAEHIQTLSARQSSGPPPAVAAGRQADLRRALDLLAQERFSEALDPDGLVAEALRAEAGDVEPAPTPLPLLIIDDSLTTRMLERSILESAGFDVDTASSAEEALENIRRKSYALFLVDIEMPGMDGFTLVERIRSDPAVRDVPVILVTSRDSPEDRERGSQVGAQDYVVKSEFNQTELLDRISRLCGSKGAFSTRFDAPSRRTG